MKIGLYIVYDGPHSLYFFLIIFSYDNSKILNRVTAETELNTQ